MPIEISELPKKPVEGKNTFVDYEVRKISISNGVCTVEAKDPQTALLISRVLITSKGMQGRAIHKAPAYEVNYEPNTKNVTVTGDIKTAIIRLRQMTYIRKATEEAIFTHPQFQEAITRNPLATPATIKEIKLKAPGVQEALSKFDSVYESLDEESKPQFMAEILNKYMGPTFSSSPPRSPKVGGGK